MLSLYGEGGGISGAGAARAVLLAGEQDEQALAAARLPAGPPPTARRAPSPDGEGLLLCPLRLAGVNRPAERPLDPVVCGPISAAVVPACPHSRS